MECDLHIHTTCSDGSSTAAEVVQLARSVGLASIAVTDHDSVEGCLPALEAARGTGLRVIPGVEMLTSHAGREIHLLGYYIDPLYPDLVEQLRAVRQERNQVAQEILARLRRYGFDVNWDAELEATAERGVVGKNHLLQAVWRAGYIQTQDEAVQILRKYLAETGLAYVGYTGHDFREGVELIRRAGGAAVLAHPGLIRDDSLVGELVNMCDGLEVYYYYLGGERERWVARYADLARERGLLVTGGSDYHGDFAPVKLGQARVPEALAEALARFCGREKSRELQAGKGAENA